MMSHHYDITPPKADLSLNYVGETAHLFYVAQPCAGTLFVRRGLFGSSVWLRVLCSVSCLFAACVASLQRALPLCSVRCLFAACLASLAFAFELCDWGARSSAYALYVIMMY
jgi:hypothetical protein